MAVSGVKARLMLFEAADGGDNNMGAGQKDGARPGRTVPPVLQKFGQNQQAAKEDVTSPPAVSQRPKWGVKQNNTSSPSEPDSVADGTARKGSVGRLNVADKFRQGAAPPPIKPVVPFKKPVDTTSNSESSNRASPESDDPRPKVALKPPGAKQLPYSGGAAGPKPVLKPTPNKPVPGSETNSSNKPTPPTALKPPSSAKPVKLPALDNKLVLKKLDTSSSTSSPNSNTNANGPTDFRSRLRKTNGSFSAASGSTNDETENNSLNNGIKGLSHTSSSEEPADTVKRRKSEEKSPGIVERSSDRKRFKRLDLNAVIPLGRPGPEKPALPVDGVDLDLICRQHATLLENLAKGISSPGDEDCDDIYDDGSSAAPPSLPMRSAAPKAAETRRQSNRVSLIPEMTAEEEGVDELIYDDGETAKEETDLLYVDAASESKPSVSEPDDVEDIYEDEGNIAESAQESEEDKKKRLKEEMKKQKELEKAKLREEEKQKKKKKEEEKKRKQFKLTGEEIPVGEGTIKEDAKGRGVLTVKKGQMVTIIRINDNPVNKWLVKTDTDMGFVDSSNIEIDPNIIRQIMLRSLLNASSSDGLEQSIAALVAGDKLSAMTNKRKESNVEEEDDDDQPIYDDVAASETPRSKAREEDLEDADEIYECVQ